MESAPLAPTGSGSNLVVSSTTALSLRVGEVVQAVVQARSSLDTVVLNMRGAMIEAKTELPLLPGQTLALKVDATGSELRLRVMQGPEQAKAAQTEMILASLAGLKNLPSAAAELAKLSGLLFMLPDAVKSRAPELGLLGKLLLPMENMQAETLEKTVANSGLFLEAKLRLIAEQAGQDIGALPKTEALLANDLKAVLLKARAALDDPVVSSQLRDAGVNPKDLGRTLNALVNNLEFQQLQSKLGESLQLFLPLFWHGLNEEWVKFKSKGKGEAAGASWSCTINLDLERVGKLRSQVLLQSGFVHVKVYSDNPAFVDAFKQNQELLNAQFDGARIKLGGLSVMFRQQLDFNEELPEGLDIRI